QLNNGIFPYQGAPGLNDPNIIGSTALAGIALMESGLVAPRDKQIQAAATIIRTAVANRAFTFNYSICLSVLFLDRLHKDMQQNDGGWGYDQTVNQGFVQASTGSMTCAGILGIALSSGARGATQQAGFQGQGGSGSNDLVRGLNEDPQVVRARAFILNSLNEY